MRENMNRTAFLVDGFNLYHSVKNASADLGLNGAGTRWLDVYAMCSSYLHAIGNNAQISGVYYFSALARHIEAFKPDVVARHQTYIKCLEATGISVELARFKKKRIQCPHCNQMIRRHEEKETDVAIAAKLLELFFSDQCDTAALVTGDTDIVPAVKTAQRSFPQKQIVFLLPYKRHNQASEVSVKTHRDQKGNLHTSSVPRSFCNVKGQENIQTAIMVATSHSTTDSIGRSVRASLEQGSKYSEVKSALVSASSFQML